MGEQPGLLVLEPDELLFSNIRLGQAYTQTITVSNPSRATVEATLRAGSSDRYTLSLTKLVLRPQQSVDVDVRLRVLKYAQIQKGVQLGQRDIFHIKAAYFEQKFYSTFLLDPVEAGSAAAKSQGKQAASTRSPRHSPRDRTPAQKPTFPSEAHALTDQSADNASNHANSVTRTDATHQHPDSSSSTPDLSPRTMAETEDPPTPRMYRSMVPVPSRPDHSQQTALKPEASQVVLHEGHFSHDSRQSSPRRSIHQRQPAHEHELQHLHSVVRDKDATIVSLQSQLADARHQISTDQRAAKVSNSIDPSSMSLQAQSQVERLEATNAQLQGSNAELRDRLHEVTGQLQTAQAEAGALQRLQDSAQDAAGPSVDALIQAAVASERAAQDTRNRKVLELLNNKDEVIQRFEDRCTEANAEIQQLKAELQEAVKELERTEGRLAATLESRNKLRKQLEAQHSSVMSLQAETEVLKDKVQEANGKAAAKAAAPASPDKTKLATSLRAELEVHKEALLASKEEAAALANSLAKASSVIEGLNAEMASRDSELDAQHERCQAKDAELADLAQQIEAASEAQTQAQAVAQAAKHEQSMRPWAVDVSLDQGIAAGPSVMIPTSPTALRARVQTLEVANEKLERALMGAQPSHQSFHSPQASQHSKAGTAALEASISSLRSLLTDREHQLANLEAELAIARSASGSSQRLVGESAQGESALRVELDVLRRHLSEKEAQIVSGEERLSRLEAVHRVAQETALRSESQLEATRRSLMELDEDKQAGKEDAESARALALRLNARVSELTLAAECARADGESARAELERVRSRHQDDTAALEKRQRQLVSALKAVGGQTGPLQLDGGSEHMGPDHMRPDDIRPDHMGPDGVDIAMNKVERAGSPVVPSKTLLAVRERNQNQAIQEAELAAAVMQAKLLEGLAGQREANRQLQEARQAFDAERGQMELYVQRARHEGAARIQALEETVRKLGNRSDLHQEIARLGGETSFLRRGEARLKSNLGFAEDRCSELQREVTILRQQVASFEASEHEAQVLDEVQCSVAGDSSFSSNIAAKMGDISHELSTEGSQPHIVARLVERAEASEMQLAQAQQQLRALKQTATARAAAGEAGTSAAISAAQALETRSGDMQRQLLMAQSDLKAAHADAHMQDMATAQLEAQLAGAAREVAAAQSRLAEKESLHYSRSQTAAQSTAEGTPSSWKEAAQAAQQVAGAVRAAESAQAAQQQAEHTLRVTQLEVARLKATSEASTKAHKRAQQAAVQKAEHAQHELGVAKRECERSAGDAEDRRVQLSVLVETVETLQAGTVGEKEQRIVSLTAQLTTAYMKQAVAERRASELQCELEGQTVELHKSQSALDRAQHSLSEQELEVSTSKAAEQSAKKEAWALRGELKAQAEAAAKFLDYARKNVNYVAKAAWEVDQASSSAAKAKADAAGLRAALDAARTRHFEQLTKERSDMAAQLRQSQPGLLALVPSGTSIVHSHDAAPLNTLSLASSIDELIAALRPGGDSVGSSEDGSTRAGDTEVPHRVVQRMKGLLMHAQTEQAKAEADHRIAAAEAAALNSRIGPLEMALDMRICERDAAVAELEAAACIAVKRQVQATTHAEQQVDLQAQRLVVLHNQLEQANGGLIKLELTVKHAHQQQSSFNLQRDDLQRKLTVCQGEVRELESRLSAACMESAGMTQRGLLDLSRRSHSHRAGSADTDRSQTVEAAIQQRDSELRAYFDTEVLKHVLNPDHQKRSLALTREICALKLAHRQLVASQAAAKKCANATSLQNAVIKQQLQALEEKQSHVAERRTNAEQDAQVSSAAELTMQLAHKAKEIHRLQEDLLQRRHQLASQDITVQELHAAVQTTKNAVHLAEDAGRRKAEQTGQDLTAQFATERAALLREVEQSKQRMQEAQQAFASEQESQKQQTASLLEACPDAEQYNQVVDAANAAQDKIQQMEVECSRLHHQNKHLQSVLQQLEVEVTELKADAETRDSALESLQEAMSKIERSANPTHARTTSPLSGARRAASAKVTNSVRGSTPGDGALAALSRQLVQSKMAEADAQRKHRVSARAELSLRQRLSQREDRICGLKDALAAAQHSPRQHLASHTQGRSRSPSPSAHVPDHAAYHSSAQSDRLLSHSRAVSGKHHTTFSSRPHVQLNSDQHQRHAQAEHSTARRSLERVHSDAEHVDSADQRQHGAEGQRHIARLPYFKPKAHGGIANSHDSGAHTKADQRSAQDTEIIARQKEFTQTLTVDKSQLRSPRGRSDSRHLSEQISDLKIELARRDADIQYLEGQLAQAASAARPVHRSTHTIDEDTSLLYQQVHDLEASLAQLRNECSRAVTATQLIVGRPNTPLGSPRTSDDGSGSCSIEDAVQQLIGALKDRDGSIRKLKALVKSTAEKASKEKAEAAAQPMEASQRAVIRDLSLRVANLTRLNNQLKEERERAQERLRTLRASLGSAKPAHAADTPPASLQGTPYQTQRSRDLKSRKPMHLPSTSHGNAVSSSAVLALPSPSQNPRAAADALSPPADGSNEAESKVEGRLLECEAVQGLCQLLEHHVTVLEQSQEPLNSLLQPAAGEGVDAGQQDMLASSEALVSQGARQALAAATMMTSAEVSAMRSTLQVLAAHLTALQTVPPLPRNQESGSEGLSRTNSGSPFEAMQSPREPVLALPAPSPKYTKQRKEAAAQTMIPPLTVISSEASTSQGDLMAEQMQQASDRAQKWKGRCAKLRQDLLQHQTAAASHQAALNERLAHVEKASEELQLQQRKELSQLQAALDAANKDKQALTEQQAEHSCSGQSDVQAAQAGQAGQAEAAAHAAALQRQIDTLKAQSAASRAGLQEETNSLKAALSKEKSERARIVLSLRDTITGLKQAGNVEGRLKTDLVNAFEQLAASRAAQEAAEGKLAHKRSEVKDLAGKLDSAQRQLTERNADNELKSHQAGLASSQMQQHIASLESQLKEASSQLAQLTTKLDHVEAELQDSKGRNIGMQTEATQLEGLNTELKSKCHQLQTEITELSQERRDGMSAKWEALLRCRRHRIAVQHLRSDLQAAESENHSLAQELQRVRLKSQQAAVEADKLQKKVDDLQHFSELERQQLAERQVGMMTELEKRMEEERAALRQEAAAMAASAAAAGEDRARAVLSARLNDAQQSAFQDITNISNERRQLVDELEGLRSQFKAYQRVKAREISSLDHRVRILLHSQAVAGTMPADDTPAAPPEKSNAIRFAKKASTARYGKPVMVPSQDSTAASDAGTATASDAEDTFPASYQAPLAGLMGKGKVHCSSLTAAAEVGMALESEAVASAVREAEYERVQREGAEAGVAALQDTLEKLKQKLKATQRDLRSAQSMASVSAAQAANAEATQEGLQQLQDQLLASQEALKTAKAESARRLKTLQSLQQQGGEGPHLVANAAFLAEKTAREAADSKLITLRRSLAHKDDLIKSLKSKVDELESAVRAAKLADHSIEVQTAESRIRSLQGSLSRKDDTIREMKERTEQAVRTATQRAAEEEAERQLVTVKKLKGDMVRKEGMLNAVQAELDMAQQQASDAAKSTHSACFREQTQQLQSSLTIVQRRAQEVLPVLRALAKLVLRAAAAMHTAASSIQQAAKSSPGHENMAAADVAKMVDMSLAEVADLLGQESRNSAETNDAATLAQEVVCVLMQLEAEFCRGGQSSKEGKVSSHHQQGNATEQWEPEALQDMVAGLQQQASRAEAALADAVRCSHHSRSSEHIAAHHSRRRRKASANPVNRLEDELLQASYGIEAELYEAL